MLKERLRLIKPEGECELMKRVVSLDYLRILSCILVIGIHAIWLLSPDENSKNSQMVYTVMNHIVRLGLPLFFMLSSVALTRPIDMLSDLNKFYLRKFISLYVPFLNVVSMIVKTLNTFEIIKIGEIYFGSWIIYYIIGSFWLRERRSREKLSFYNKCFACNIFCVS